MNANLTVKMLVNSLVLGERLTLEAFEHGDTTVFKNARVVALESDSMHDPVDDFLVKFQAEDGSLHECFAFNVKNA